MNLNVATVLFDLEEEPMKTPKGKDATVRFVFCEALILPSQKEGEIEGQEKARRFALAQKIAASQETVDLSVDDVALLKKLIGNGFPVLVVGQVYRLIEAADKPLELVK